MHPPPRACRSFVFVAAIVLFTHAYGGELKVSADFPGGSAHIESIDQSTRTIRFIPGGDPARGWVCWWSLRVDGTEPGEKVILDLGGSDLPTRNNGAVTDKPLAASWATPGRAAFSTDGGKTWSHTEPGRRSGARMIYDVTAQGGSVLAAWGPPFTLRNAEELASAAEKALPSGAKRFELARTRANRPVPGVRISEANGAEAKPFGIWLEARQHAWESGSSWVAQGVADWLISSDESAGWLRKHAEIVLVPIMDVDNVETGNGGKEADPRDHNRDWTETPVYPEVAAAQAQLRKWAKEGRLDLFINLHNPGPADSRPFFFCGPIEIISPAAQRNRAAMLAQTVAHVTGPLTLMPEIRLTGPKYHPLWRQMSAEWVAEHGNPQTFAACLETSWNTPHSTAEGYRTVGRQLAQAIAAYFKNDNSRAPVAP